MKAWRTAGRLIAAIVLLVAIAVFSGPANAAPTINWPHFMFNTAHTGFNNVEPTITRQTIGSLSLEFGALGPGDSEFGNSFQHSSPAVVNGVMYAGTSNGQLLAFSAIGCGSEFCAPLWSAQLSNGVFVSPAVVNGVVYIESAGTEDGRLYAFAAGGCGQPTCRPLWSAANHGNVGSSPTVAGGVVYSASRDGHLYAYNAAGCGQPTCGPVWSGAIGASAESAPAVVGSVVYVAGEKRLFAFRAGGCGQAACAPLWRTTALAGVEIFSGSGPAVSGGNVYIGSMDTSVSIARLYAFNANGCGQATCAARWRGRVDQNNFDSTPAVAGGLVYIGATDGLFAFNANGCGRATCAPVWRGHPPGGIFGGSQASPAVAGGLVYSAHHTNRVAAYDARGCGQTSCAPVFEFVSQGNGSSAPVIVNGRLYVAGSNFGFTPEIYVFELVS